ncbi:hypothetical protein [Gracilimonas sp.]|uniref:hypothetical protein n=1 Tax=Gracilimonas sp. TaxID=1974203 RepID=UPI0032F06265
MISRIGFTIAVLAAFFLNVQAQDNSNFNFSGNARFSYGSSSGEAFEHFEGTSFLRVRVGAFYGFNENHGFKARLATTQSSEFPEASFTIKADGGGLNTGSISFDEFYYQFKNEKTQVKAGRFQHTPKVLSNAGRSHMRFMSNNINIHWIDGIYVKRSLNEDWYGEVIGEYQPRNHTSYSYRGPLNFGNNEHNVASYLGLENRTRDDNNFIQKGFGLFVAPNAYLKPSGYSTYFAVMSHLVYDLPKPDALNGGSFRVAAELGQNLNAAFEDGTSAVLSLGINNFADKHQFMVEFARTDSDWLTPNVYAPNADELEIRYRYFISDDLNIDFRYRIRESRSDFVDTNYNFFARATYSF